MQAKSQLRMVSLQRARAVAVAAGAAEQLAEVEVVWHQMEQHLNNWQHCHASVLRHFAAESCVEHRGWADDLSNVSSLMSQLLQDKEHMQRMAATLQEVDVGTALLVTELRELCTSEIDQGHTPAHSAQSCTSEHRRLYQQNCQRLKSMQALQTAANRSRSAAAAVIERLVGAKQSGFLRAALLSWRGQLANKVLAANTQRLCDADDLAACVQERSIAHATALVQRNAENHGVLLKRAVFTGWNKQLWLAVRTFPSCVN